MMLRVKIPSYLSEYAASSRVRVNVHIHILKLIISSKLKTNENFQVLLSACSQQGHSACCRLYIFIFQNILEPYELDLLKVYQWHWVWD